MIFFVGNLSNNKEPNFKTLSKGRIGLAQNFKRIKPLIHLLLNFFSSHILTF